VLANAKKGFILPNLVKKTQQNHFNGSRLGHSHLKKVKHELHRLHELQSVLIARTLKTCKICSMQF
jgi:hypothetical protein